MIAATVAAIALLSLVAYRFAVTPVPHAPTPEGASSQMRAPRLSPPLAQVHPARAVTTPRSPVSVQDLDGLHPAERYEQLAVYPPTSRPLLPSSQDLIDWNRRHERPLEGANGVEYLLTADAFIIAGEQPVQSWLTVTKNGAPIDVHVERALLQAGNIAAPITFELHDTMAVARFVPAKLIPSNVAQRAELHVDFRHDEGAETARISFRFTASPPARFTGHAVGNSDEGDYLVNIGVEVSEPGHYIIDANLWDADRDSPLAWARFKGALRPGNQSVPLRFAGNAILDRGGARTVSLSELRGSRYARRQDLDLEDLVPWPASIPLGTLPQGELSSSPWQSPRKQARLRVLRAQP